jgi:hypothetical protein
MKGSFQYVIIGKINSYYRMNNKIKPHDKIRLPLIDVAYFNICQNLELFKKIKYLAQIDLI